MEYLAVRLIETKADDDNPGTFSGYGAVFGNEDAQGDVIRQGAFKESLSEWRDRGKFPPMLNQHGGMQNFFGPRPDDLLPIGQWTSVSENARGLKVEGRLFALGTERGQYIYEGLKSGALDGLSIGYKTREFVEGTRAGEPDRILTNLDLWEISVVTFPANPKARIASVKSLIEELRDLEDALRDAGMSRTDCQKAISVLKHWRQRDAGAPNSGQRDAAAPVEIGQLLEVLRGQVSDVHAHALQHHISTHVAGGFRV